MSPKRPKEEKTVIKQIICLHKDVIIAGDLETCPVCDQILERTSGEPVVIQRGKINGIPTYVVPPTDHRYPGDKSERPAKR